MPRDEAYDKAVNLAGQLGRNLHAEAEALRNRLPMPVLLKVCENYNILAEPVAGQDGLPNDIRDGAWLVFSNHAPQRGMIVEPQKGMGGTQTDEPQFGIVDMRKEGYAEMLRHRDDDGRVHPQFFVGNFGEAVRTAVRELAEYSMLTTGERSSETDRQWDEMAVLRTLAEEAREND